MINGFVHIVESPSPKDLLDGRTEGRALGESLTLAGIRHCYSQVSNRETLHFSLQQRLEQAVHASGGALPIIHFSAHGCDEGIQLTDGQVISWAELGGMLQSAHDYFQHGVLVCLSTCKGHFGIRMAMKDDQVNTFWALVAHTGEPTWSDSCVGFITFYHRFFKGLDPKACVEAMKEASGDNQFVLELGASVRADWNAFVAQAQSFGSLAPQPNVGGLGGLGGFKPGAIL